MKTDLEILRKWIDDNQSVLFKEDMTENQSTIYYTFEVVKKEIDFLILKNKKINTNTTKGLRGHYGC